MDRITAIRKSLTGFVCGIFGFFPVVGLAPAIYALICWRAVRLHYRNQFNPASAYLIGGAALALFGLISSLTLFFVLAMALALNLLD